MSAHYLYRCVDASGRLVYVGIARDLAVRLEQHTTTSWWADQVVKVRAVVLPDREAARDAERRAIRDEQPLWNLASLPPRRTWDAARYENYVTSRLQSGPIYRGNRVTFRNIATEYRVKFGRPLIALAALERAEKAGSMTA